MLRGERLQECQITRTSPAEECKIVRLLDSEDLACSCRGMYYCKIVRVGRFSFASVATLLIITLPGILQSYNLLFHTWKLSQDITILQSHIALVEIYPEYYNLTILRSSNRNFPKISQSYNLTSLTWRFPQNSVFLLSRFSPRALPRRIHS